MFLQKLEIDFAKTNAHTVSEKDYKERNFILFSLSLKTASTERGLSIFFVYKNLCLTFVFLPYESSLLQTPVVLARERAWALTSAAKPSAIVTDIATHTTQPSSPFTL